jgi:hypothetical protein
MKTTPHLPEKEKAASMMNVLTGKAKKIGGSICELILNESPSEPADAPSMKEAESFVESRREAGRQERVLEMAEGLINLEDELSTADMSEKDESLFVLHDRGKGAAVKHEGVVYSLIFLGEGSNVEYVKLVGPPGK